ncbi:MAG: hypothetical protein AAYR33_05120 [Acetobacteraceae bacterium]
MRLTVAIPADLALQRSLSSFHVSAPHIEWVETSQCFLIVRELGTITDIDVLDALDLELLRIAPRGLEVNFTGLTIEPQGLTDAIYLEVAPDDVLTNFRTKIENATRRSGHRLEKRRYRPRLRLGQAKTSLRAQTILWTQKMNLDICGMMHVDRFCLLEMRGDASQLWWEKCEDYPLSHHHAPIAAWKVPHL